MKKTSSIETNSIKKIKVTDVCPAYYGAIEIINGNEIVVIFIKKNTPLPCSVSKSYFTEYENQDSINIRITESATSEDNPDFVNILQEKVIQLPPISNAGYEIKVTFNVDNNGVLHASILNVESGEKSDITIAGIESNLTDQFTVNDEVQEVESKYGSKFIGIDLGTTYSAISTIDEHGIPKIINNSEGQNITPSCIWIKGNKKYEVGEEARKELGANDNVIARFKRDMGTKEKYSVNGENLTPTDCSALVLKKLFKDAQKEVGDIGETVVTIPANFTNEAREATLEAAKSAGLNVQNIVDEPTAAALYYAFKGGVELKGNFAVFDLGGGTFDISLIKVDQQNINVLASEGVQKLGGDDFDTILQKIATKKLKDEHDETIDEQDYTKTDAEEDKKSLSKRESVNVRVNKKNVKVTRAEFEEKISSLVMQTEMVCESILAEQNLTPSDLEAVFLVGGSTRVPLVQQAVERVFKQKPTQSVNVDEAVALGASLYAAFKGDQSKLSATQKASVNKIKVTDVCPSYFGTIAVSGETGELANSIIIEKNTPRPCSVTRSYYTMYEGQDVLSCTITECGHPEENPDFVKTLRDEDLKLPPGRPANLEIQTTYSFDDNGLMHCSFKDVESGDKKDIQIGDINPSSSGPNKMDEFTVD